MTRASAAHPDIAGFADAAALTSLMDLVITVDTAAAHLAGTLGRPVWILLAHARRFSLDDGPDRYALVPFRPPVPPVPSARLGRAVVPRRMRCATSPEPGSDAR